MPKGLDRKEWLFLGWIRKHSFYRRLSLTACFLIVLISAELHAEEDPWIQVTGFPSDLAIDGPGWFILRFAETGEFVLTRDGAFRMDNMGRVVSADGLRVQGIRDGGLEDLWIGPDGAPPTADPLATVTSFTWTEGGELQVELTDGTRFRHGQLALQYPRHPERLIRRSYKRYIVSEAAEPLAVPTTPGKEGTGKLIPEALSTEPEPFRLETLSETGVLAHGLLARTGVRTDLAIRGPGVFLVRDPSTGGLEVTRAGCFLVDREGYLITYDGWRVQGYKDPAWVKEGDIQIDGIGRPVTADPDAVVSSYSFGPAGQVIVALSDGSSFIRGQIFHYQVNHPRGRSASSMAHFPLAKDQLSLDRILGWLEAGRIELVHLSPQLAALRTQWTLRQQGPFSSTGKATDLAISGEGWFVVRDPVAGSGGATRIGRFELDSEGYLITEAGYRLQGFADPELQIRGDLKINAQGRPASSDLTAILSGFSIEHDGRIHVRLSDGTEYVRGQITLQTFREEFRLRPMEGGRFTGWEKAVPDRNAAPGTQGLGRIESGAMESPDYGQPLSGTDPTGFRLLISGEPGATATLERSSNLIDWSPWQPVHLVGDEVEVSDHDISDAATGARYYRVTQNTP